MMNDLAGLKVLELATVLAGPSVGMFLAELGASVTKIENPRTKGDVTRQWKQSSESSEAEYSAYFASVNWGKQHMFLDLSELDSLTKVQELANEADVIISNYRPGQAERFLLDYETISNKNRKVIYGHISGFGEEESRPAFDVVLQAESGFMFMNGQPMCHTNHQRMNHVGPHIPMVLPITDFRLRLVNQRKPVTATHRRKTSVAVPPIVNAIKSCGQTV